MSAREDRPNGHISPWWTLAVLCLSLVMVVLGNTVLNVALPTLVRELHASSTELQWMVDSYALVFAGLLLTAGTLGDRFGRKGALVVGLVIFGGASFASTFATEATLERLGSSRVHSFESLYEADREARRVAAEAVQAGLASDSLA